MREDLPAYPAGLGDTANWQTLGIENQYAKFDALLSEAERMSVFDSLPDDPVASKHDPYDLRGQVIAERLWLLGYFDAQDVDQARAMFTGSRELVLDAVEQFQADTCLKIDRWPGVITWRALGNLVSFEVDDLDRDWLENPDRYPSILRAVQCRLHVLGLSKFKPDRNFHQVDFEALRKFKLLTLALGACQMPAEEIKAYLDSMRLETQILTLLLNQDSLIEAVAKSREMIGDKLFFKLTAIDQNQPAKADVRVFLVRLVQIEFWLMGYDIKLMVFSDYSVLGLDEGCSITQSEDLKKCLVDFARLADKPSDVWSRQLTPDLFTAIKKADEANEHENMNKVVSEKIKNQAEIENTLQQGRKLHLRLWDGIKRVIRWIGKLFKRAAKSILDLGKNIARFFFKSAQIAFDVVRKSISMVAMAMATLDGSTRRDDDTFISVSMDGDVLVGISQLSSYRGSSKAVTFMRLDAERFYFASSLCALILSALIKSAFSRWASLAITLYDNLKVCIETLNKIYALEKEMDYLTEG